MFTFVATKRLDPLTSKYPELKNWSSSNSSVAQNFKKTPPRPAAWSWSVSLWLRPPWFICGPWLYFLELHSLLHTKKQHFLRRVDKPRRDETRLSGSGGTTVALIHPRDNDDPHSLRSLKYSLQSLLRWMLADWMRH